MISHTSIKDLLVVGPGSSIEELSLEKVKDRAVLAFGDSTMSFFETHNIYPDYWTFIDPNTVINFIDTLSSSYKSGLKTQTRLLYSSFQGTEDFYAHGFTTEHGEEWVKTTFAGEIFPPFRDLFEGVVAFDNVPFFEKEVFPFIKNPHPRVVPFISHRCLPGQVNDNGDKFSTFLLPLCSYFFPNLQKMQVVGFGDFSTPKAYHQKNAQSLNRYGEDFKNGPYGYMESPAAILSEAYGAFLASFNFCKPFIQAMLKARSLEIEFLNQDSSYVSLAASPSLPEMEKITFCIPSKSNLRYLKGCVRSIRENACRPDHDIIVFVDSDEDGTLAWLQANASVLNITYYTNPSLNEGLFGIGEAYDFCVEKAETPICMIFHADMILGEGADVEAYKYLEKGKVVCSTRIEPPLHDNNGEKILHDFGEWPEDFKEEDFNAAVSTYRSEYAEQVSGGMFAPWMVYKEDLFALGGHDPIMKSAREDSDLFNRMKLSGLTLVQSWSSLVYHFTGRGGQFQHGEITTEHKKKSEEWQRLMHNSTREFIRKWGTLPRHTPYLHPIIVPKYQTLLVLNNPTLEALYDLEPHFSFVASNIDFGPYVAAEQPNTSFQLSERLKSISDWSSALPEANIIIHADVPHLSPQDVNILKNLNEVISTQSLKQSFTAGSLKVQIKDLSTFEQELIQS